MRQIILVRDTEDKILLSEIHRNTPIFAKKDGVLCGMVVNEDNGWIVRIGGSTGATGHHETLEKCLNFCPYGYTFHVV